MKLQEILQKINEKTGKNQTQSDLARVLEVSRQTISTRIKNQSEVTVTELQKVEQAYGISILENNTQEFPKEEINRFELSKNSEYLQDVKYNMTQVAVLDYYPDVLASCGNGVFEAGVAKEKMYIPKMLIKHYTDAKKYSVITAKGNSMAPFVQDGDKLVVEHFEGGQIQDECIYVFCYNSEIFVKRLSKNIDQIVVKSDNLKYPVRYIEGKDLESFRPIGQIVGILRGI